jgi:hypothetical protein
MTDVSRVPCVILCDEGNEGRGGIGVTVGIVTVLRIPN